MGAVAAELYSLGHRANFFYLEHAMGLASSIGLGIALAQPGRKVVAEMPKSFLMDVHMLENRFEFPRALQQPPRDRAALRRPTRIAKEQPTTIPALKSREE